MRESLRRAVAVAVVLVMTTSSGQAFAVDEPFDWGVPERQREKSVTTTPVEIAPVPADPAAGAVLGGAEAPEWPEAARGEVDFAGRGSAAQAAARAAGTPIRAAGTPVAVGLERAPGQARQAAATGKVRVEVRDAAAGGVVFTLADAGGARDKPLKVTFDYAKFAGAFGGDYAARLRLVRLPGCAATTPEKAECQVATPVEGAANDTGAEVLSGTATLRSAEPAVFAAAAAPASTGGSYAATSLAPAGSWNAGGSSGDFTYGYPMRVPPAIGGGTPSVSLGYSAQSLDGRTSSTNNQASWAGDGWDLSPAGFIERQYKPCSLDLGGNNGQTKTGDQCWATDNATISLVGVSGKLIRRGDTNEWRTESDDGARIERLTGAANGDNNGEHWKVTTTDGTQYFLGMNRLPGWSAGKPETQSAWTVPVYGNHTGEECNQTAFDASWCQQAYRWNLDYSVDVHGNVTTYYYNREFNRYGRNGDPAKGTDYVRGGWLDRIDYGLRSDNFFAHPGARVSFETAERCLPGGAVTCDPSQLNASTAKSWPDVPFDQICNAGESCTNRLTPSFFTRKKLTKVVTRVANGASSFQDVDSWTLEHQFLATGDGLAPALNLNKVTHTGLVGGSASLPPTVFGHTAMDNRVDSSTDGQLPLTRYRITSITNETGANTTITYSDQDCKPGARMPASPESNTLRCYPSWWAPEGALEPQLHWFHKYVVVSVIDTDRTGASTRIPTTYEYKGDPAWHFDEAEFAEPNRRTWSQWRGYATVRTVKGDTTGPQSVSETVYGRGMDGDKLPDGTREAWVDTEDGDPVRDVQRLRGFVLETRQYQGNDVVSASVNDPYLPDTPTATDAAGNKAYVTGNASVRGRTKLENGTWRRTRVDKEFNAEGIVTRVEDHGDLAVTGDESCTRSTYARNETAWILTTASQVETVKGTCAVTASPTTVLSLARSYYDNQDHGVAPTRGLVTKAEALDKWDATGQTWVTASQAAYDSYGRPTEVVDGRGEKTTTAYVPASGPVTEMTSTNPLGHVTREYLAPAWGLSTASVDVNNRRAELAYDPLGRLTKAWTPGHAGAANADAVFEYQYNTDKPSVVVSKQLQDNGGYLTAYTLYDGLLRERQTQIPAPGKDGGRQITDILYDSRGLPYKTNGIYWNKEAPSGELTGIRENELPAQTITEYDALGRPTAAIFKKFDVEQWRTTTSYGGDRVHTTPPSGGTATTVISDAQGRTLEKRQYTAGLGSTYDTTRYAYNAAGLLETLTDPAGNTWRYHYDLRGRVVATDDPDTGHSTVTYNAAGQVLTTTDSQNRTIANAYDKLGRTTARHQGSLTGTKLAEWEYDTLTGGVGMLTASRRFVDGQTYEQRVNGYDDAGRATGQKVIIPASEGVLGATYELRQSYTATGKPNVTSYSAVTSGTKQIYPRENVGTVYDAMGLPIQLIGSQVYVGLTEYSSFGEVLYTQYADATDGAAPNVGITDFYEIGSRRLERTVVSRETATGNRVADRNYTYDAAGNITRIADTPEGRAADIQCFAYDHLRRMNEAWTPLSGNCSTARSASALGGAAPYWHSWTFDKTGNRLTETQHAAAGDTVRTTAYPAAGAAQPHTATSVTTKGPNGTALDTFTYDTSGRTKTRKVSGDEQVLDYDAEGRISKITNPGNKVSTYLYDANGSRLISREPSATTLYVFGQEIRLETGTSTPSWTRWYGHNGKTVAVRNSVSGLKWLIPDHQGTNQVSLSTDASLAITQRRQSPYGAQRGAAPASWPDKLGFVGGRNDESGLTQVGARLYDNASGRFLSADPVIDNNDPQQLNGYAYANNSPVTFSDPTGLIRDCGPDGVMCGTKEKSIQGPNWEAEKRTYQARERALQQARRNADAEVRQVMANQGISQEDYARALADAHKTKWDVIKEVAWDVLKEISGWNDIVDCFTKGDIWGCAGMVAGLVPWGKVGKILEAGWNAIKAVDRLASIVSKAQGILRRVQSITDKVQEAVTDQFQKLISRGSGAGESCVKHSFVGTTLVLMADGSTKPISEVEIGDKVKATDPTTGQTTDREVVATIVHDDEGDMTKLTVVGEDGTTGSVDATSWHPVWVDAEGRFVKIGDLEPGQRLTSADGTSPGVADVDRYTRFEPVYDLTVDGVHTYYVATGGFDFLVHNCGEGKLKEGEQYIYRAVKEQELDQLLDTRRFQNAPGIESKYFSATPEGAALYARTAHANFPEEGPYTLVRGVIRTEHIPAESRIDHLADGGGGIDAFALWEDAMSTIGRVRIMPSMPVPR
ncbi:RHS repeat-associated core domain-containing protein [Saccharothrix syringae]|uniref:Type IV secretion protein Rhs n=1 Tax=Saccharothrix syringae TaxID=103733 RepID=A0A5Q0GZS6_SACSY|nr:RHS repeat-associated core domain-containing protein [Saccharothrix syringae]QFZ19050.1 type IV secretion protein Rhs [Saccharothrix syringae]